MAKRLVLTYLVRRVCYEEVDTGPGSYADERIEVKRAMQRLAATQLSNPEHGMVPESVRFKLVNE